MTPFTFTADQVSFTMKPKPFKQTSYFESKRTTTTNKRTKNLKQVLLIERERVETKLQQQKLENNQTNYQDQVVSFMTVDAAPSVIPPKKYCDITGLEAHYVDPKSNLRYHNSEIYQLIKTFQPGVSQAYLSLRGQAVVLR
ncbi:chromatin-remodeling complex subunit ies6 [Microbotryomycetes sp. JL221]|nr:chromatin-remodeling complex subunit ies6 [Microbotryomycetes sp. JL221]